MRTLFEKYLQEHHIKYSYVTCIYCRWKIYLLVPDEHNFECSSGRHLGFHSDDGFNYRYYYECIENCPKCGKIRVW